MSAQLAPAGVTLDTGEYVQADHPDALIDMKLRRLRVERMLSLPTRQDRLQYMGAIRRTHGEIVYRLLVELFKQTCQERGIGGGNG